MLKRPKIQNILKIVKFALMRKNVWQKLQLRVKEELFEPFGKSLKKVYENPV